MQSRDFLGGLVAIICRSLFGFMLCSETCGASRYSGVSQSLENDFIFSNMYLALPACDG